MKQIKNKNLISLIILIVIAIGIIYFLGVPFARQSVENYKKIKDKKAELAAIEKNISNLENLKSKTESLSDVIEKAEIFIPAEKEIGAFLVQMEAAAKKSDVSIINIDTEEANTNKTAAANTDNQEDANQPQENNSSQASSSANETSLNIEASGDYSKLVSFLERMKKLSRFNIIKDLSISSGDSEKNQINASFTVTIFNHS